MTSRVEVKCLFASWLGAILLGLAPNLRGRVEELNKSAHRPRERSLAGATALVTAIGLYRRKHADELRVDHQRRLALEKMLLRAVVRRSNARRSLFGAWKLKVAGGLTDLGTLVGASLGRALGLARKAAAEAAMRAELALFRKATERTVMAVGDKVSRRGKGFGEMGEMVEQFYKNGSKNASRNSAAGAARHVAGAVVETGAAKAAMGSVRSGAKFLRAIHKSELQGLIVEKVPY